MVNLSITHYGNLMIDFEKLEELKTILEFSTALTEEFAKENIVADEGNEQGVDSG